MYVMFCYAYMFMFVLYMKYGCALRALKARETHSNAFDVCLSVLSNYCCSSRTLKQSRWAKTPLSLLRHTTVCCSSSMPDAVY